MDVPSNGVLDAPRTVFCLWCGLTVITSLAAAAREGWEQFEDDSRGPQVRATCPSCVAPGGN